MEQIEIIRQMRNALKKRGIETTRIINKISQKENLTEIEQKFIETNRILNSELNRLCKEAYNTLT
jgi:hypothetical protein